MKKIYILIALLIFNLSSAQSNRSLDETKSYITKMINDYGWEEKSYANRLNATFEGDLLRIVTMNTDYTKPLDDGLVYNFANIYRFKGPIKEPGDVALIIVWVDILSNEKTGRWKKDSLEMKIHNYEVAEQLMIAFGHLNKLLIEKKPAIEKF